jgi:TFIIH basal transcription factor complex TTD-A subunit
MVRFKNFVCFEKILHFSHKIHLRSDPAMRRFLLHLDETLALGSKFVLHDLDETHLFIETEILPVLQERIDELMEQLAPDLFEK